MPKPREVADAGLFLASDQIESISGVLLNVDGGRHLATNRLAAAWDSMTQSVKGLAFHKGVCNPKQKKWF